MFVLTSEITAGNFKFSGVHDVVIRRGIRSIVETAVFTVPAMASVSENGKKSPERIHTASKFKPGDAVTIALGYGGELNEEFRGFVKEIVAGTPLKVVCEGYSWLLRNNAASIGNAKTLKALLQAAVAGVQNGTSISVVCDDDVQLTNIIPKGSSGFDLVKTLQDATDNVLTCFFAKPGVLWCGSMHKAISSGSFPHISTGAGFRPGFNALQESALKPATSLSATSAVKYSRKKNNGVALTYMAGKDVAGKAKYEKVLNQVADAAGFALLAEEKLQQLTAARLEGNFTAFLQPFVRPGNTAYIEGDGSFSAGAYLVESTEVTFGISGARRKIELGAALKTS